MKWRRPPIGLHADYPLYFERLLVSVFLPIFWIVSLILVVGSDGELGCSFSNNCDHLWSSDMRTLFFVLLLGPPLTIWGIWVIVAWLIRNFSHSN
jgi:hypothetical protein